MPNAWRSDTIALDETPLSVQRNMTTTDAESYLGRPLTRYERSGMYYAKPFSVEGWKSKTLEQRPYWTRVIAGYLLGAHNFRVQKPLPEWAPQSASDFRAACDRLKPFGVNGIGRGQLEKAIEKIDGLERGTLRKQRQAAEQDDEEENDD